MEALSNEVKPALFVIDSVGLKSIQYSVYCTRDRLLLVLFICLYILFTL